MILEERHSFIIAAFPLALLTLLERVVTFVVHLIIAHLYGVSMKNSWGEAAVASNAHEISCTLLIKGECFISVRE